MIAKARIFPYQLMMAYTQTTDVPNMIREALQDAMEIAIQDVPKIDGKIYVCPDQVFTLIAETATGNTEGHWVNIINKIEL